jgi:protein-tyrosine phosphatase
MDRRTFLTAALAGGTLALTRQAFAATALDGTAVRLSDTAVRLEWTAAAERVSAFVSTDPDTPAKSLRPLTVSGKGASIDAPVSPRPYFLLQTPDGRRTRVAERLLPLKGGRNFRDLGGYWTQDGRQVRWGRIFRSGAMTGLTAGDMDYLGKLGVAVVCDLRNPDERRTDPSPFLKAAGAEVLTHDYDLSAGLEALGRIKTREEAVGVFADTYVRFIDTLSPNYTEMFDRLVQGKAPLAMNCTAGKDRTGVGSALVLSLLGVPRETVVADYALTQVYSPPSQYSQAISSGAPTPGLTAEQAQALARLPKDALGVIVGSDPEVMRQALAGVDRKFGGPEALAKAKFNMTDAKIARLRSLYLA